MKETTRVFVLEILGFAFLGIIFYLIWFKKLIMRIPIVASGCLVIGLTLGWYSHGLMAPSLLNVGLGLLVDEGVSKAITEYEVKTGVLQKQAEEALASADHWKSVADKHQDSVSEAHRLVAELEARKPEIERHIVEVEKILEKPAPAACEVYVRQLATLKIDLEWSQTTSKAKNSEIAELTNLFVARDMEIKDLRNALDFQTERADEGVSTIAKIKKQQKRTRLVGVALVGAAVFLAVR